MSPKKRVHELAKSYGMQGKQLAEKLREWGFTSVKSHMSALDEFETLQIQGRLEAMGYSSAAAAATTAAAGADGGLIVRKKKKKVKKAEEAPAAETPAIEELAAEAPVAADAEVEAAPAPDASPEPEVVEPAAAKTAAAEPEPPAPEPESEPLETEAAALEPVEPDPVVPKASSSKAAPSKAKASQAKPAESAAAEPAAKGTPAETVEPPTPASAEAAPVETAPVDAGTTESAPAEAAEATPIEAGSPPSDGTPVADAPMEAAASAEAQAAPEKSAEPGDGEEPEEGELAPDGSIVRPSSKRRQGKVVGFIDLSKIQADKPRRESRRLQSADDGAAPDVQPTRGGHRRAGLSRAGDSGRGQLTAAQLREREAGRFLRRSGLRGGGGRGGGGRGRGGPRRDPSTGSPFAGTEVKLDGPMSIKKLADGLAVKQNEVLKAAFSMLGFGAVNINSMLDDDTAVLLANEFEVDLEIVHEIAAEEALLSSLAETRESVEEERLEQRPPSVAVLGHVDHGKTTLIDALRSSTIADGEAGGITQHIGAYQVETSKGHRVTVVDTPGHAAFTAMRARGAKAVDIVILVVAADDGVMPQTIEAINHAKAAGTPIVVALNKIDKAGANPDKVLAELSAQELMAEEYGGQTAVMRVSALERTGIDELLERVFLESELLELRSHMQGPAAGIVLEARVMQGRGIVADLLVQDGSLNRGDVILAGEGYGKVRSIHSDRGEQIESAGPATPVEVTGLDKLPGVGDHFHVVPDLAKAKEVAEERARSNRMMSLADRRGVSKENLFQAVAEQNKASINLIIKGDVQGSVEVIKQQLGELEHDEVAVRVLHAGVGAVSESDVDLAISSDARIMAFHVGTGTKARQNADRDGVEIHNYTVIYELLDDVRKLMEGSLTPDIKEEITGHAEIRKVFSSSRLGNIAGCHVLDGKIVRDSRLRLLRDGTVVFTGQLASLRREADDTKEVREGFECGMVIKNYNDVREGDVIEAFKLVEVKRTI